MVCQVNQHEHHHNPFSPPSHHHRHQHNHDEDHQANYENANCMKIIKEKTYFIVCIRIF